MLPGLCEAIDARPYMEGHGSRVSELAEAIALRLGWGAGRIRRLRIGALLHDVRAIGGNARDFRWRGNFGNEDFRLVSQLPRRTPV